MLHGDMAETLSRDELRQLQIERLQSTLHRAYRNVAFYREAFDARGVDTETVKSLDALGALPVTTRGDLARSYPYGMFAVPLREVVRIHSVPGSTGTPIVVGYTRNDLRNWTDRVARILGWAGITPNDVVQILFQDNLFTGGFGLQQGAESLGASVIPSPWSTGAERQVRIMRDYKTTAIFSTPSHAMELASVLREMGVHPERMHLRIGIFGGEPWTEADRARLDDRLRLVSLDTYGMTDVFGPGVAGECQERKGLHLNEDQFIVEVVDPKTLRPLPAGQLGELVLTTLTAEAFPLIRYRTGDVSAVDETPCACGRTLARIAKVTSRTDDRFYFRGLGIFPSQIEEILASAEGASPHYQIILEQSEGKDTLQVRVEVSETFPSLDEVRRLEELRKSIEGRIETILDVSARIVFVEPRSLARDAEGRSRGVVDRRGS